MTMGNIDLGRVGIWTGLLDLVPSSQANELATEAEEMGYLDAGVDPLRLNQLNDSLEAADFAVSPPQ